MAIGDWHDLFRLRPVRPYDASQHRMTPCNKNFSEIIGHLVRFLIQKPPGAILTNLKAMSGRAPFRFGALCEAT